MKHKLTRQRPGSVVYPAKPLAALYVLWLVVSIIAVAICGALLLSSYWRLQLLLALIPIGAVLVLGYCEVCNSKSGHIIWRNGQWFWALFLGCSSAFKLSRFVGDKSNEHAEPVLSVKVTLDFQQAMWVCLNLQGQSIWVWVACGASQAEWLTLRRAMHYAELHQSHGDLDLNASSKPLSS